MFLDTSDVTILWVDDRVDTIWINCFVYAYDTLVSDILNISWIGLQCSSEENTNG